MRRDPDLLHRFLKHLTTSLINHVCYQIESGITFSARLAADHVDAIGAQIVQLFDSWAHHLSPDQFCEFSLPYVEEIIQATKQQHPEVPIIFHMNGGTGKLALMHRCSADVIGLDWHTDMNAARNILGSRTVQVRCL